VLQRSHTGQEKQFSRFLSVGVAFPDEARAVSLRFGNIGTCLSGNYLAKDDLKKFLSGNSILHFACHGYFDPKHYLDSGLLLRITETPLRKEILSLRDIMTWHLDSDLVILSACETGRGTVAPSEFLGLSRGFLAAGAQSVIVALWKIDNDATQAFMLTFYENLQRQLKKGDTIDLAEALRQTQNQYAKSSMFHWAGFKLIGQPTIVWKGGMK
jgi:CHAT domain-containing protein